MTEGVSCRACPGCGNGPVRSLKIGEWSPEDNSGVYQCDEAGCRVERYHVPDWSVEGGKADTDTYHP